TPTACSPIRRSEPGVADSRSRSVEAAPELGCRLGGGEVIGAGSGLADDRELDLRGDLVAAAHDSTVAAGGLDVTGPSALTAMQVASGDVVQRLGHESRGDGAEEATVLAGLHVDACRGRLEFALGLHSLVVVGDLLGLAGLAESLDVLLRACGPCGCPATGQQQ